MQLSLLDHSIQHFIVCLQMEAIPLVLMKWFKRCLRQEEIFVARIEKPHFEALLNIMKKRSYDEKEKKKAQKEFDEVFKQNEES